MYWMLLLALMLLIPTLTAVQTWRELRHAGSADDAAGR